MARLRCDHVPLADVLRKLWMTRACIVSAIPKPLDVPQNTLMSASVLMFRPRKKKEGHGRYGQAYAIPATKFRPIQKKMPGIMHAYFLWKKRLHPTDGGLKGTHG